jgi:alpha-mannosidase
MELVVEAASNPAFPMVGRRFGHLGSLSTAGDQPIYTLRQASLALRNDDVFHLLLDVEVLLGLMTSSPPAEKRRQRLLRELERRTTLEPCCSGRCRCSPATTRIM